MCSGKWSSEEWRLAWLLPKQGEDCPSYSGGERGRLLADAWNAVKAGDPDKNCMQRPPWLRIADFSYRNAQGSSVGNHFLSAWSGVQRRRSSVLGESFWLETGLWLQTDYLIFIPV